MKVGLGLDAHRFAPDRPLLLGGVRIRERDGLAGHSDADVLAHAVMDAMLGASGREDIGYYFPGADPVWQGADSMELLKVVAGLVAEDGRQVVNVDAVVVCEEPRIAPHRTAIRRNMSRALGLREECVSVRGTTTEGMGFTGRGEGIAAQAVVLLEKRRDPGDHPA